MEEPQTVACLLCGDEVEAVALADTPVPCEPYPPQALEKVENVHGFYSGPKGYALLHHVCASRTPGLEWNWAEDWWACQEPGRPLDKKAHFELHCPECARRWGDAHLEPSALP